MRRSRYAESHRDANEPALVKIAEQLGAKWYRAHPLDGWVFYRGVWLGPAEIKLPEREGLVHEYTPAQKRFLSWAQSVHAPTLLWRTDEDVLKTLNARRSA